MKRSQDPRVIRAREEVETRSAYGEQYVNVSALISGFTALDNGNQGPTEEETAKALLEWLAAEGYTVHLTGTHDPIMRGDRARLARAFAKRKS